MITLNPTKSASSCNVPGVADPMMYVPMVIISLRLPRKTSDSKFGARKKMLGKIGTWNTFMVVFGSLRLNRFSADVTREKVLWVGKATTEEPLLIRQYYMSRRSCTIVLLNF